MKLSGIVVEIKGKKYELSMESARELYYELDKVFGEKTYHPFITYPVYPSTPDQTSPWQPYTPDPTPPWQPYTTCSSNTYMLTELNDE